ncbi:peroxisomal membrane protein PEX14 [Scaptodrosophila lebanonensis]|uniref:Peroxisomal membrane protein PEX14 n=1 Tax=Drosophila lebanonensis TaxID=7225 RepID=A0A6J2TVH2_DROLE|nr:peroxisomal membrane protein PEX14 [Scaptodrosophila lebanonensis]
MVVAAVQCYRTSENTASETTATLTTTSATSFSDANSNCSDFEALRTKNAERQQATAEVAVTNCNNNNNHNIDKHNTSSNINNNMSDTIDATTATTATTNPVVVAATNTMKPPTAATAAAGTPSTVDPPNALTKSAVSQRNVDIRIEKTSNVEAATQQLTKKVLKLDLGGKNLDEYSLKSPKSPIAARLPHQTSLTSSVDVEDRKTLREALYQGIFHRHRRTIFAVGSFLRMLRSRNSQYNTIRSSSEGEDIDEFLKARKLLKLSHFFDR